jgi:hypothetical protein
MRSTLHSDPAFHDQTMGLLGPGLWRDLIAVLMMAPVAAVFSGAMTMGVAAVVLGLAGAIGVGARMQESRELQLA